jgi:aspartyl-tRNA(Asn)/glutamyl-tRNA(Gln) amidotransferase subunit A
LSSKLDPESFWLSISDLHAKLAAKAFTCTELTEAWLDRLERSGSRYNALAHSLRKPALRRANDVDRELKRGRTRGPLQGVPYGAKDLLSFAGEPTAWGSDAYAGQVFPEHATAIAKLERAGAVCIGKLAMVELAGAPGYRYASASATGACLNPWDMTRWSGGSSSGSGAAVAAGLVPYAIGSETWGSILNPSAYCGVTGLRPTYGLVSRGGAMTVSWTLDKIGPMCRSAADCGLVLAVLAGADSRDPGSAGKSFYNAPEFQRANKEITIGWAPRDLEMIADAETRKVFAAAYETFRQMGFVTKEIALPAMPYGAVADTIIACESASYFEELIETGGVNRIKDAYQAELLQESQSIAARDYLKAMRIRSIVQDYFRRLFIDVDILLAPSAFTVATRLTDRLDRPAPGLHENVNLPNEGLRSLDAAGNLAGLPALSLPCGFAGGLPLGMSLVSRSFQENLLLAVGRRFQERTDWHKKRPQVVA